MTRLVVVSSSLPQAAGSGARGESGTSEGGLVRALLGALRRVPGSLWLGWNGRTVDPGRPLAPSRQMHEGVELVGFPLPKDQADGFDLGFCNETLWPLLHCFQGRVGADSRQEACYRGVQARFAGTLLPLLKRGDVVWVHDYHLLLLGRELRRLGWHGRVGFFLHTPFPPHEFWQLLPAPQDFLEALLCYDLVGFQTAGCLDNYVSICRREVEGRWSGGVLTALGHVQRAGVYPAGIEPRDLRPAAKSVDARHQDAGVATFVRGRKLILGVDRLDYTKGIPERILGFERFVRSHPEWRRKVVYLQVASPSRAGLPEHARQKRRVDSLIGRVNGALGEHDWTPIRYLYRTYPLGFLAGLYREADVMLVTPLRDGMNLVAKEFVAAQDADDPGVLVLSRCAGAAEQMREAVIVNPLVASDLADGIHAALSMDEAERRRRHRMLLARVVHGSAGEWGRRFLEDLTGSARPGAHAPAPRRPAARASAPA